MIRWVPRVLLSSFHSTLPSSHQSYLDPPLQSSSCHCSPLNSLPKTSAANRASSLTRLDSLCPLALLGGRSYWRGKKAGWGVIIPGPESGKVLQKHILNAITETANGHLLPEKACANRSACFRPGGEQRNPTRCWAACVISLCSLALPETLGGGHRDPWAEETKLHKCNILAQGKASTGTRDLLFQTGWLFSCHIISWKGDMIHQRAHIGDCLENKENTWRPTF